MVDRAANPPVSPPEDPPVLDRDHLARQTFDDVDLQIELIELFRTQCRRLTPVVAGEGALKERADAAHTLKGGALGVGAFAIAAAAQAAEGALREQGALAPDLLAALTHAIAAFEAHVAQLR
ncbi:MAG: Hpt domain-containing protein [Microvirga sp.]|nr:Hpt domain-containing protein [Microvirga sp.]